MLPALVLTAGLGTRLDPLTRLVAKPAVPVAGPTLVERVLAWLHGHGVRDAVLNLHHRPDTIAAVIGDGVQLGLHVRYSWEREILGSAGGPRHALPLLDRRFVIVNGDTLCDLDLAALVAEHDRHGADVTLAVIPNPAPDRYNGIAADAAGRVTGFVPKGRADGTWHFVGVQVVNADVFAPLADGRPAETIAGLYRDRVAAGDDRIRIWPARAPFVDIGTPRDYLDACRQLARGGDFDSVIAPAADVHGSARVTRSVIWPGAHVGADAQLDECVVTGGLHVPASFRAQRSVIVPASVARDGDRAVVTADVAVFPLSM